MHMIQWVSLRPHECQFLNMIKWSLVKLTDKVFFHQIRNLRLESYLHQKSNGFLIDDMRNHNENDTIG